MSANIAAGLRNLITRGVLALVDAGAKMQRVQMKLTAGETKGGMEHFEPYGFTSHPLPGAEGIAVFLQGDRSHGVVISMADRRFRLTSLEAGEVALYTDEGDSLVFKRGRTTEITTKVFRVNADEIDLNAPIVKAKQDLRAEGTISGDQDVIAAGVSGKDHRHVEVQRGSEVSGGPAR